MKHKQILRSTSLRRAFFVILHAVIAAIVTYSVVLAVVVLSDFKAFPDQNRVILKWITQTELDNAGFYVQRSNSADTGYARINQAIIPARGDSLTGATYVYTDTAVTDGIIYWYKLEAIDLGQGSAFYGPITAIPGATFTPSVTPLPGQTTTPPEIRGTPVSGLVTNTPAPGVYPAPTDPYPGIATTPASAFLVTATLEPGSVLDATQVISGTQAATATLIPFPTLSLVFPTTTGNAAFPGSDRSMGFELNTGSLLLIGLILVWILLGIGFFLSLKRLQK
jgi:hypothetical protein